MTIYFKFIFDKLLRFTDQNLLRKKSKISSKIIENERLGNIIQHVRTAIRHCFATFFFFLIFRFDKTGKNPFPR